MPNYKRNRVPGGTYFFTLVTCNRQPILTTDVGSRCLHDGVSANTSRTLLCQYIPNNERATTAPQVIPLEAIP
jgi:REP element-mobilizing transposase RayT